MAVKPIPEGYRTVAPYLAVEDAAAAFEYYNTAFGAKARLVAPLIHSDRGRRPLEGGEEEWPSS